MHQVMTRYLTEQQQQRLLATVKAQASALARRDFFWLRLLRDTGLRIGEFAATNVRDARFAIEAGWLHIPKERRKGRRGKRRDHQVPVTAPVQEALRALLSIRLEMGGADDDDAPLVLSREGGRMSVRSFEVRMAQWCRAARIEGASPHWLRHTRAINLIRRSEAKNPLGVVQALLGHSTIASTGIYTRVSKEDLVAAARKVDGAARPRRYQVRKMYETRSAA